ncbi:glycosyltransferase family protein [Methanoregula sp.]|uniref:glycosyltransferase family protein n=1 Tax=Methanoregula sp. TaxID=2052170 RepID=UPI000CC5B472|nr:glycosyltransferase family protein [Methanoregula sp.]PKG31595.1 MAG: glycosyl transferase family 28 [Methanoregula sp.]
MKVLFVVCGEGLGHASRCLHLGHYMQLAGHTVHFAGYGKSYDFMSQHRCSNLHRTPREVCLEGEDGFFSLKATLWCSKWILLDMLRSVRNVRRLIRDHGFDCVVCDTMYGGVLAARLTRTPCAFITNQNHFNGHNGTTNPVWRILNFLIRRYLRLADHVLVPDYAPPDTVSEYNIRVPEGEEGRYTFTGPFYVFDPARYEYAEETIFTSFGGEPYKLPMYRMLRGIADQHKEYLFDVFYTGAELPESSDNFISHGYVPNLYEHLARAKIAIVHGGLTTLHEALLFEKPVLIIMDPNHPEQQNNARKIVDMGAGTAVDGRLLTKEVLEAKITKTLAIVPRPFRGVHEMINGRQHAMAIIEGLCRDHQP